MNDAKIWLKEETLKPLPGGYEEVYRTCEHIEKDGCTAGFKGMVKSKNWSSALDYLLEKS